MKKSDKKRIGKTILNGVLSFVKGATMGNPVVNTVIGGVDGVVKGIQKGNEIAKDKASEIGGVGNVNWTSVIGAIVGGVILLGGMVAVAKGWITTDELKEIFKLWESTQ